MKIQYDATVPWLKEYLKSSNYEADMRLYPVIEAFETPKGMLLTTREFRCFAFENSTPYKVWIQWHVMFVNPQVVELPAPTIAVNRKFKNAFTIWHDYENPCHAKWEGMALILTPTHPQSLRYTLSEDGEVVRETVSDYAPSKPSKARRPKDDAL